MTEHAWADLFELLAQVEDRHAQTGMFAFDNGGVFVENGRVCWAAARGMAHRLSDLLSAKARPGSDLDALYRRCREDQTPFGETVVASGIVSAQDFESTLRQHTAESLVEIMRAGDAGTWTARAGQYAPRFTFAPRDTFFDVVDTMLGRHRDAAREELGALATPSRRGAAFVSIGSQAIPVMTCGNVPLRPLGVLGAWAMSLRDAAYQLAVEPRFAIGTADTGDTTVVWWQGPLTFALRAADRPDAGEMTSYLLQRRAA